MRGSAWHAACCNRTRSGTRPWDTRTSGRSPRPSPSRHQADRMPSFLEPRPLDQQRTSRGPLDLYARVRAACRDRPVPFRAGRVDGAEGAAVPHGRLPDGALGARHLRTVFYRMGFDDEDIVALSGAHTLGRCHADRSGFEGPWTSAPLSFDTEYYQLLLECEWTPAAAPTTGKPQMACAAEPSLMMLHTDVALVTDARFKPHVERFAKDQAAFFAAFAKAFARLQENGHANLQEV
eukprot:Transcript_18995.p2 GENE.Transcript_18995~~Transcript_18995.p2  ORF type:complete len:236 (+),score=50.48 Transcript_18995:480-1187(+)